MFSADQILDLLEKAFRAGCFEEVHKMIQAGSALVLIEKVIEKSQARVDRFPFDINDIFGAD